ncbi:hypothetical protein P280DRAFT_109217 [Massarina eburnea CBS 473.64]|uniref:Extracellular membrane protein CFEM domain-containing protein n=1 Tax=Massarina eburnea CBS 473.64 TaxID=1395130 RepID=A0A6A6RQC3_9PLEO|nr:hypothetical protein P280DRAFT_109217 [Massarina eburnea CBS 473.64]
MKLILLFTVLATLPASQSQGLRNCGKFCARKWSDCMIENCWLYDYGCPKVCIFRICEGLANLIYAYRIAPAVNIARSG